MKIHQPIKEIISILRRGHTAIPKTMEQMKTIGDGFQMVQRTIGELNKGSQEIGEIVNLISSIAGQTNYRK